MTNVYAVGLFYLSACTDDPDDVATRAVNMLAPTLGAPWEIADEPFHTGEPNPHPCEHTPGRRHLLFSA